eukprot:Nitzschia sp. Nitz4//scaffold107_size73032//4950//7220//NITZ4_005751-RA/size73032-snap-gene-0.85-mRNA-1//-1//CDS//3329532566//9202//frame0
MVPYSTWNFTPRHIISPHPSSLESCCNIHRPTRIPLSMATIDQSTIPQESCKTMSLNEFQTRFRQAVAREDILHAEQLLLAIFDRLEPAEYFEHWNNMTKEEQINVNRARMTWAGMGVVPWLTTRLQELNFTTPTTIQMHAMEAVAAVLAGTNPLKASAIGLRVDPDIDVVNNTGVVVSGSTGSGKTLSYLVPMLSTLSASLFSRERIRIHAAESIQDTAKDMMEHVGVAETPNLPWNQSLPQTKATPGASVATLGKSGEDVKAPLGLVVLTSHALGYQTAKSLYHLVGGNPWGRYSRGQPQLEYTGPKGVKIGCVLTDQEAEHGLKLQTDICITLPKYLGKLMKDGDVVPSKLRFVAYDEADLALEMTNSSDLTVLFDRQAKIREYSRLTFMVGASVTKSLGNLAVRSQMLPEGRSYIATATGSRPLSAKQHLVDASHDVVGDAPKQASFEDLDVCLDPGLIHQRMQVEHNTGLLGLTRHVRQELKMYKERLATDPGAVLPRVIVFCPNEVAVRSTAGALGDALWNYHWLNTLLPETGTDAQTNIERFTTNVTSLLVTTPSAVRGLDFPGVTHVYTMFMPLEDPRDYVHLAGRVGRVGQLGSVGGGGKVISVVKGHGAIEMDILASELGIQVEDVPFPPSEIFDLKSDLSMEEQIENLDRWTMVRHLEDMFQLDDDRGYTNWQKE